MVWGLIILLAWFGQLLYEPVKTIFTRKYEFKEMIDDRMKVTWKMVGKELLKFAPYLVLICISIPIFALVYEP